jgi:hypothetical protein
VQPVLISREPDYFDGSKPFRCVWGRNAQRRQLTRSHQNLNVTLREAEQLRRSRDIKANARKWFATVDIERMSCDPVWLDKAIRIVEKQIQEMNKKQRGKEQSEVSLA